MAPNDDPQPGRAGCRPDQPWLKLTSGAMGGVRRSRSPTFNEDPHRLFGLGKANARENRDTQNDTYLLVSVCFIAK
jgi:hypothetical protein